MKSLLFLAGMLATTAASCSSGDTTYMCNNLNTCWSELGFTSCDELQYLCDIQGLQNTGCGAVFPVDIDEGSIVKPEMQCCKVYGDPHIVTYDGKKYDYMGSCSYIISQDLGQNWQVYGTYKACGDRTKQLSCIVSITVIFDGEVVQFLRMFRINYRGSEFSVPAGGTKYLGQMRIENKDFKYYIYLGNTGVRVMWDGMTQSETCLPSSCGGGVEGMCGNADCNPDNEFDGFSGSSGFGNSWVVGDPRLCDMEPSDGNLGGLRTRPCDYVSSAQRTDFRNRCNAILDLSEFANCLGQTTLDRDIYMDNCMFDSCSGLSLGGGCDSDQACEAGAGAGAGWGAAAVPVLDPACMMGLALANDCRGWGAVIGDSWRNGVYPVCPSDDDIAVMRVCP